jgi:hypothetical protein
MHDQQPRTHDPAERVPQSVAHEPIDEVAQTNEEIEPDDWLDGGDEADEADELPPRPRRRLLTPIPLALLAALLIAGGFIGGVQVQKGQETPTSAAGATSAVASRFAALRGRASTGTGTSSGEAPTGGAGAGGSPGAGAGASRPTTGTVAYLAGDTLYVTNPEGNTVKVSTSAATRVTKSVKANVDGIHPGETVTVTGAASGGAVTAESISVGSASAGLAGLFGGPASKGNRGGSAASAAPQLFGSG